MVSAAISTIFAENDAESARAQLRDVVDKLTSNEPKVAQRLQAMEGDLLAYATFPPPCTGRRSGPTTRSSGSTASSSAAPTSCSSSGPRVRHPPRGRTAGRGQRRTHRRPTPLHGRSHPHHPHRPGRPSTVTPRRTPALTTRRTVLHHSTGRDPGLRRAGSVHGSGAAKVLVQPSRFVASGRVAEGCWRCRSSDRADRQREPWPSAGACSMSFRCSGLGRRRPSMSRPADQDRRCPYGSEPRRWRGSSRPWCPRLRRSEPHGRRSVPVQIGLTSVACGPFWP
jgi:hypothetical protein